MAAFPLLFAGKEYEAGGSNLGSWKDGKELSGPVPSGQFLCDS